MDAKPAIVAAIAQRVFRSEISLELAADELEQEAFAWASGLYFTILRQWADKGISPERFDALAHDWVEKITEHAVEYFSVHCEPETRSPQTAVLIGDYAAVVDTEKAPHVDSASRVRIRLKQLHDYPQQYARDNLFRYQVLYGVALAGHKVSVSPDVLEEPIRPQSVALASGERREMLRAYKEECRRNGVKVTDDMIAKAARPTWNDRTPIQRWVRNYRTSAGDDVAIRKVLQKKPHLPKHP